ncbi:MAG: hypothetical protein ACD_40C00123G0007 [uncultured bacterium]|nr:MAG: hypothetical protein ACD_40C00123G0007 [uncultured bacterium]
MTDLLSLITPTNLQSEKEKFFVSKFYHPVFNYIWQDQDINPMFSSKLKQKLWEEVKIQNHSAITLAAANLFEVNINENTLSQSKRDASIEGKSSRGSVSEFTKLIKSAFTEFSIDYTVEISNETGFNARLKHQFKKLIISKDVHFDYFSMEGGVHHDMTHIIRYLNSKHNNIKKSQNYLPTEEGLASWCQDNTNDDNGLAQHAMEYVASSIGIKGSLQDIFDSLCDLGMSEELAWKRACRHKFGFINTKEPGDILKPAMYYQNELKIGKLSPAEKLRLFVGKISLDELKFYPNYSGTWSAEKLHGYFQL